MQTQEKIKTGFPSVDKPWLKYYKKPLTEEDIPDGSAYHFLFESNKNHMEETAIIYFNRKITYRELFSEIKKTASALSSLGIGKGDIVTLQVLNMPQTVALFYGISYIGAVANMIYITSGEKEVHELLLQTNSKLYVTIDSLWSKLKLAVKDTAVENVLLLQVGQEADFFTKTFLALKGNHTDKTCLTWNSFLPRYVVEGNEVNEADLPVAMVYTSGTTGKSKAVVLSNRNMNSLVCQYAYADIGLFRGNRYMNSLPPFIAFGLVFSMHLPLCLGLTEILVFDPQSSNAGNYFAKYKPNYFVNGKAALENIMYNSKVDKMDLGFVKVLAAGGEAMPPEFERRVGQFLSKHHADTSLSIGYGMSEVAATVVTSTPRVHRLGTVGIPLPGTTIKIVEPDTTKELTYNTDGEICFHSPTTMIGYFMQEAETHNIIKYHDDGMLWVHSGDIGRISEDGFLTVSGRIKRLITIQENGIYHKVFPKPIEDELAMADGINSIVIVGRKKPIIENELIAFAVKESNVYEKKIVDSLNKIARDKLETWERPAEYRFIEKIPRTTVGKIDYLTLEKCARTEK